VINSSKTTCAINALIRTWAFDRQERFNRSR
jgi:hypothetical protein